MCIVLLLEELGPRVRGNVEERVSDTEKLDGHCVVLFLLGKVTTIFFHFFFFLSPSMYASVATIRLNTITLASPRGRWEGTALSIRDCAHL